MKAAALNVTLLVLALFAAFARADVQAELRHITEHLAQDDEGRLPSGEIVYQTAIIAEYYYEGDYQPAWNDRAQAEKMVSNLGHADREGLNPDDYHHGVLRGMLDANEVSWKTPDRVRATFDVLLTDGVILYIRHLKQGKVDPRETDPTFNYSRLEFKPERVATLLREAIAANTIDDIMEQSRPQQRFYQLMRDKLARYRPLAAQRSFTAIPDSVVLKPGQSHDHVVLLRQRLVAMGYLDAQQGGSRQFSEELEEAVRHFQRDNNLDVDGIVGRQSYALLNLSWNERVNLLRINMDRFRWIYPDVSDDFIVVNIAGFELYYLQDRRPVWETPVMVGTIAHQTPLFTKRLRYLEFNPTWTVPRSIIRRSLFPKFSANPQYVIDNKYHLLDRKGQQADPLVIDWSAYNGSNFPYDVVQQPGEHNALGRVKFMFPNRYAIYLHDTPSRALFSRSSRAFSSGCVRVKDPLRFAEILLDDPDNWSLRQIEELIASGEPIVRVNMPRAVDVMLMYWTASPTPEGGIQFHPDIYGKDPATLAALDAPPNIY